MADKFTVGLVQMRCTTDKDDNLTRAEDRIREAAARGAQIVCLHELFAGEYFCRTEDAALFDLAEPVPGPTTDRTWANTGKCIFRMIHCITKSFILRQAIWAS